MVTTKRANDSMRIFETNSNVALLERAETPVNESVAAKETTEEARARMQRNLDKLLHYENYTKDMTETAEPVKEEVVETEKAAYAAPVADVVSAPEVNTVENEDIMPTKTTLQFGNANDTELYNEAKNVVKAEKSSFKLNLKGKIVAALYVVAVAAIFTLIILNSGVISMLSERQANLAAKMEGLNSAYERSIENLDELENKALDIAEKEYGMRK